MWRGESVDHPDIPSIFTESPIHGSRITGILGNAIVTLVQWASYDIQPAISAPADSTVPLVGH